MVDSFDGFIINPEVYWRPAYRISPYTTAHVKINRELLQQAKHGFSLDAYFGSNYEVCLSGKAAITRALEYYNLSSEDEVWIVTTSGNTYISSCVTNEIEKKCRWSMEWSEQTRIIFVNHEFGFCYQDLASLKKYQLPIIEDRALSFNSQNKNGDAGKVGDFVIYSLPKYFPVNAGGILQQNIAADYLNKEDKDGGVLLDIAAYASYYLNDVDNIKRKRQENYEYLAVRFQELGFKPFFEISASEAPGAFMFKTNDIDLPGLKTFMQHNGVESSVFYGQDAFFIPVHQSLDKVDMDFLYTLVKYYCNYGAQQH